MSVEARIGLDGARAYRRAIDPLVVTANTCLPPNRDQETLINHSGEMDASDYVKSWGFLGSAGAPRRLVSTFIDKTSKWIHEASNDFKPFRNTIIEQLHEGLEKKLGKLITLGNWSLRRAQFGGVNDHSILHVKSVAYDTVTLLDDAGCDHKTQEDGAYAAWGHDLGNVFGKGSHARISVEMLKRLIPDINKDSGRWKRIRRAIALHDSSFLTPLITQMDEKKMLFREKTDAVGYYMGKVGAALYIADKLHVNENRLILDPFYGDATDLVEGDLHKLVNSQLETQTNSGLLDDGKTFVWHLKLDPFVSSENYHRLKPLINPQSTDLRNKMLPLIPRLGDKINRNPKKALKNAAEDFHKIYPTRRTEMPLVVFALFPQVTDFQIIFSVETEKGEYKEKLVYGTDRDGNMYEYPYKDKPSKVSAA